MPKQTVNVTPEQFRVLLMQARVLHAFLLSQGAPEREPDDDRSLAEVAADHVAQFNGYGDCSTVADDLWLALKREHDRTVQAFTSRADDAPEFTP